MLLEEFMIQKIGIIVFRLSMRLLPNCTLANNVCAYCNALLARVEKNSNTWSILPKKETAHSKTVRKTTKIDKTAVGKIIKRRPIHCVCVGPD